MKIDEKKWEKHSISPSNPAKNQYQGDLHDYEERSQNEKAYQTYEKLGIKREISVWASNIQRWVGYTFIPSLMRLHQNNTEEIDRILSYYNRFIIYKRNEETTGVSVMKPILWEDLCQTVMNDKSIQFSLRSQIEVQRVAFNEAQLKKDLKDLVQERMYLERYFRMQDYMLDTREYVIERLKQLQGNFIGEYQNNGGGNWKGEAWSNKLPRDSDVKLLNELFVRLYLGFSLR